MQMKKQPILSRLGYVLRGFVHSLHILSAILPNSLDYSLEETLVVQPPDAGKQKHVALNTRSWKAEGGGYNVVFNLFVHNEFRKSDIAPWPPLSSRLTATDSGILILLPDGVTKRVCGWRQNL